MGERLQIGAVSKRTGLSVDAIRYYERERLFGAPPRSPGGFRLYAAEEIRSLRFIREAQALGFSLDEIRELLSLRSTGADACSHVRELLEQKLGAVRGKIRQLRNLERGLQEALRQCDAALRRSRGRHAPRCPILERSGPR
ncbi:MAG: heavy metal-responsive transcriptional regulator [Thermoanaerobaculia bacterium]